MRNTRLNCYQIASTHKRHKNWVFYIVSVLCWILVTGNACLAQTKSNNHNNDFQLGMGGLLPVPRTPLPGQKKRQSTVPPPPGSPGVAVAPLNLPLPKPVQRTPTQEIKSLENSFIQQQLTGVAPKTPSLNKLNPQKRRLPKLAADTNKASFLNLGLPSNQKNESQKSPVAQNVGQEFTAPGTPAFNQITSQPLAPLPPLPGMARQDSVPGATPTFNQLINAQNRDPNLLPPLINNPAVPPRQQPPNQPLPLVTNPALREPFLRFQGVYVTQGGDTSARARLEGVYPLSPQALVGATLDLTSQGSTFDDSRNEGLNINELYLATSVAGIPNLRFVIGQLDLTSYFDRNSFAKDGASQFFNPVFQTNPALAATGIASRTGLLVNWSATDNIEAKAAIFSSSDKISDFSLDGFAGEIGIRYGNAIIRGTYATDRDSGIRDSFAESFGIARNSEATLFGPLKDDREEAYGLNAEVFIPNLKLGLFGRYGRYENRDLGKGGDTYVVGGSLLDLFTANDRLGLAYGRALSNDSLRRNNLDVLELYYDFQVLPYLRLGFTVQGRDGFDETVVGVRVRSDFDITPRGRNR